MPLSYGHFDDHAEQPAFVIDRPLTPRPWINYLSNRRLRAFISQNAGGCAWYLEPLFRRVSRYHYLPVPQDQPGFYVYVSDASDPAGGLWNPHYGPTQTPLDSFACRHEPGLTGFRAERQGLRVAVDYFIPPDAEVMIWLITAQAATARTVRLSSYLEFGLLEVQREPFWAYLKAHNRFAFDPRLNAIRYEYGAFEAPYRPAILMGCSRGVDGFECARDVFVGRGGSLAAPAALLDGSRLSGSELPEGGHGCGVLSCELDLAADQPQQLAFVLSVAEDWPTAETALTHHADTTIAGQARDATRRWWAARRRLSTSTGQPELDRFVNTWGPQNTLITAELARIISTDHPGVDGLRYRDTAQDALGVVGLDPEFAADRLIRILAHQHTDGSGCFAFYPDTERDTALAPDRSDNTVWPVYTAWHLVQETGNAELLLQLVPFRDGDEGTILEHLIRGLRRIDDRRGSHGLPILADADWNDGLALFEDPQAGSVLNAMQLVYAARLLAELADLLGDGDTAAWCRQLAERDTQRLNEPPCWDGHWYSRLIRSDGYVVGSAERTQGRVFLNPQSWAIISGVAPPDRAQQALAAVAEHLDTEVGLRILAPAYRGFPEPEDPPKGSRPGTNENGAIFCHANTWAIIAAAMQHNPGLAHKWFTQMLPENVAQRMGEDHYEREPYVCASTIIGPDASAFGRGGISWLSGTAAWLYVAATQHLLGVQPRHDGLHINPCLPPHMTALELTRRFRGHDFNLRIEQPATGQYTVHANGQPQPQRMIPYPA